MKNPIVVLLGLAAGLAAAGPITYTVNLPPSQGTTNGSFVYDSSLALGSQFSGFTVNWSGLTFNLTSAANSPLANGVFDCGTGSTAQPQATPFQILAVGVCTPSTTFEVALLGESGNPSYAQLLFVDVPNSSVNFNNSHEFIAAQNGTYNGGTIVQEAGGFFSVTPATNSNTPEPGTTSLMFIGGGMLVAASRRFYSKIR